MPSPKSVVIRSAHIYRRRIPALDSKRVRHAARRNSSIGSCLLPSRKQTTGLSASTFCIFVREFSPLEMCAGETKPRWGRWAGFGSLATVWGLLSGLGAASSTRQAKTSLASYSWSPPTCLDLALQIHPLVENQVSIAILRPFS